MEIDANRAVPAARQDDLVTTEVAGETLVYDRASHQIHHLNRTSSAIWRLCDGHRSLHVAAQDLQAELGVPVGTDTVRAGLGKLACANLLDGERAVDPRAPAKSRRSFVKTAAALGIAPVIVSVTAPAAAAAGSCQPGDSEYCTVVGAFRESARREPRAVKMAFTEHVHWSFLVP